MKHSSYNDWFFEIIAFYRDHGFFSAGPLHGLTDEGCKDLIERRYTGWFHSEFELIKSGKHYHNLFTLEKYIVAEDRRRVWSVDSESVWGDSFFYTEALEKLGEISNNVFRAQRISERWEQCDNPEKPKLIHLEFDAFDTTYHFWIFANSDHADPGFISAVNECIGESEGQFGLYGDCQDWFVVFHFADDATDFVRRGYHRKTSLLNGLVYPAKESPSGPQPSNPQSSKGWLFAHRGFFRYKNW